MKIVGCDLHAGQQTIAMVDTETGEFTEKTLIHEGDAVRAYYAALEGSVVVGIEATGAMQWFLELLEELGIECRVGHPAKIRAQETRKQKHDRRDARLLLQLLSEDRFPEIWMPSIELRERPARFDVTQSWRLGSRSSGYRRRTRRSRLHIVEESRGTPMFPISRLIRLDPKFRACRAEERVLCGIDDNGGVPTPYCQITWLRMCDLSKVLNPVVKLGRISVAVKKARLFVNSVN